MNSFRIQNIKSFKDSGEIEVRPITIFVGKNSCGKSSLLRFPVVLSQSSLANTDSPIQFYGKLVDYGNYEDVIHQGKNSGKISFEISYSINVIGRSLVSILDWLEENQDEKEETDEDYRIVTVKTVLKKRNRRISVEKTELFVCEKCIYSIRRKDTDIYRFHVYYYYEDGDFKKCDYYLDLKVFGFENFIPIYSEIDRAIQIIRSIKGKDVSEDEVRTILNKLTDEYDTKDGIELTDEEATIQFIVNAFNYSSSLMRKLYSEYEIDSRTTRYIGPFRENPERVYRDLEYRSKDVGVRGENVSNLLIRDFYHKRKLITVVSEWTNKVIGYSLDVKDLGNGLFQIVLIDEKGFQSNIIDNGFGISQVLPIVTQIIRSSRSVIRTPYRKAEDETVVIEQPELHLHPAAQAEMADLFAEYVINGDGKKKLIIETHSEHLIRKLQVLISDKDNALSKDMIKIYYIDKDDEGVSVVKEMKINEKGKFIEKWPTGFFDKSQELAMELLRKSM